MPRIKQDFEPKHVVRDMEHQPTQQLVNMIEQDLRQVIEMEVTKFRDRYSECKKVDSIYLNEDISIFQFHCMDSAVVLLLP